jgi:hypothetical protein
VTALDGPLSDQALDRLRMSAAMAVAFPQMAVTIRSGDATHLEVRWTPAPEATHRVLPPCAFHRAVASAVQMRQAGERIAMRGVPASHEPAIDWGVAADARLLPGGVLRVDDGEVWLHAGPVLADEHLVAAALADAPGLDARRNAALGVTIVHGTTATGDRTGSHAVVDAVLDVVARAGVADLEQRLSGRAPAAPEPRSRR